MLRNLSVSLLLLGSMACQKNECNPSSESDGRACITLYDPVCGCDGVTYGNECEAAAFNIIDWEKGKCIYDIQSLLGTWIFLGYESEGAKFGSATKTHPYDMEMTIMDKKSGDNYEVSGKSSINFMQGSVKIINKGKLTQNMNLTTKISGTLEALKYEDKFVRYLGSDGQYQVNNPFLSIKSTIYSQDGNTTPSLEVLIFRKK